MVEFGAVGCAGELFVADVWIEFEGLASLGEGERCNNRYLQGLDLLERDPGRQFLRFDNQR